MLSRKKNAMNTVRYQTAVITYLDALTFSGIPVRTNSRTCWPTGNIVQLYIETVVVHNKYKRYKRQFKVKTSMKHVNVGPTEHHRAFINNYTKRICF